MCSSDLTGPLLANSYTILGVVGLLIVWFLFSAGQLYRLTTRLITTLRLGRSYIEAAENPRAFAAGFEATDEQLVGLAPLLGTWPAFRQTLIIPETPAHPVRSTIRPDEVFDLGLLRAAGLRPRYH